MATNPQDQKTESQTLSPGGGPQTPSPDGVAKMRDESCSKMSQTSKYLTGVAGGMMFGGAYGGLNSLTSGLGFAKAYGRVGKYSLLGGGAFLAGSMLSNWKGKDKVDNAKPKEDKSKPGENNTAVTTAEKK